MSKNKLDKLLGESTVLVVLIPALAYFLTYSYQFGYCTYYNVPTFAIRINTDDVLGLIVGIGLVLIAIIVLDAVFADMILKHFFKQYDPSGKVYRDQYVNYAYFCMSLFLFGVVQLLGPIPKTLSLIFLLPVFLAIIMFVIQHICFKKKKKKDKKEEYVVKETIEPESPITGCVEAVLGWKFAFLMVMLGILFLLFWCFGNNAASKNNMYYSIDKRPDVIGVSISDHFIVAKGRTDDSLEYTELINFEAGISIAEIKSEEFSLMVKDYHEHKREEINESLLLWSNSLTIELKKKISNVKGLFVR